MDKATLIDKIECVALVLGGTMITFLVDGFINAVTILKPLLVREGFATAFQLDWILSSMVGGCYLSSPLVELFVSKFGYRISSIIGGYTGAFSIMAASYATNYLMMFVILGVFGTMSFALQMITSIICVSNNFENKRPLAIGIITCGTGLGITVYSLFTPYFLRTYDWRSVLILIACINIQAVVFGVFMKPRSNMTPEDAKNMLFSQLEKSADTIASPPNNTLATIIRSSILMPSVLVGSGIGSSNSVERLDFHRATVTDLLKFDHKATLDLNQMIGPIGSVIYLNKIEDYIPGVMRHEKGELARLARNGIYMIAILSSFISCLSFQTPITYMVEMMLKQNYTETDIGAILMVYGIFNSLCRVSVGFFASSKHCNVLYTISGTSLFCALSIILCPFLDKTYQFYLFAISFGFGQGNPINHNLFTLPYILLNDP
ncbi:[acyl-carrier-protein] S-malonyltransferase [Cichlidogyrus casuarinus]|uniref:[acyl-carrier-protein] S-malonyltransferase n=1 Tax=Cichlidogyrus casuarinus TaxID=1844966 RepID=A0ABD2Q454_9PLAT